MNAPITRPTSVAQDLDALRSIRHPDGTCTCGACKERVRPRPRDPLAYVTLPTAILMSFVVFPMVALAIPLNVILVLPTFIMISGLWGFTSRELFDAQTCPACRKALRFTPT